MAAAPSNCHLNSQSNPIANQPVGGTLTDLLSNSLAAEKKCIFSGRLTNSAMNVREFLARPASMERPKKMKKRRAVPVSLDEIELLQESDHEESWSVKFMRRFYQEERKFIRCLPKIRRIKKKKAVPQCPICLEDMVGTKGVKIFKTRASHTSVVVETVNCGHKFHLCCIQEWLKKTTTCPLCRTPVNYEGGIDIAAV